MDYTDAPQDVVPPSAHEKPSQEAFDALHGHYVECSIAEPTFDVDGGFLGMQSRDWSGTFISADLGELL